MHGDLIQAQSGAMFIMANPSPYDSNTDFRIVRGRIIGVNPDTIGRFTGLKDENMKEIWEGDIVKAPLLDPIFGDILADTWCNAAIRFRNGSFIVSYYGSSHNIYLQDLCDKIEVIGNIFDNMELLED